MGDWKSVEKIRKTFKVSRQKAVAILNRSLREKMSYYDAYLGIMKEQNNGMVVWNEKIEKQQKDYGRTIKKGR
jgi:hypothetical protein